MKYFFIFQQSLLACALIISSVVAIAMLPWSTKDFQRGKHEAQYVNSQLKIWVRGFGQKYLGKENLDKGGCCSFFGPKKSQSHKNIFEFFLSRVHNRQFHKGNHGGNQDEEEPSQKSSLNK